MARKQTKNHNLLFALVIGIVVLFLAIYLISTKYIKTALYTPDCNLDIKFASGKTINLPLNKTIVDKQCHQSPLPIVSVDSKYVAFELKSLQNNRDNNGVYVYNVSKQSWKPVYIYGAAIVKNIMFSSKNNLIINLIYEGKSISSHIVKENEL